MVTVRVPATTANLGPGFDTLGLALALYNTLTFEELAEGLYFEGVDPEYATAENLAVVAYKAVLSKLGLPMPGLRISVQAEIPICRGLGSSAALIAAGAAGANANHGSPMTRAELLAVCNDIAGHPDNLAMSGLPQTGQLNWPVPLLAVSGVVLFAFGWALDRKYRTV